MHVLGIDLGTQSLKAIVIDDSLEVCGEHSIAYAPSFSRPGWAEQDPQLWLDALRPSIEGALAKAELDASDIANIGVTGQLDGCLPVDRNNQALAPAIIWMDRRASGELVGIDPEVIRRLTGTVLDSTHMAAKIKWFERNLPDRDSVATWHQPVSFLVDVLCGRRVMDHSLASTTMLYGLHERSWSDELLATFGIDRAQLPDIADATSVAGTMTATGAELTGLRIGTPVIVGTGDDFAGVIGAGVLAPGTISCCVGTAEVVGSVSSELLFDDGGLVETHGFPGGQFFIENPGWLSGGAVSWFVSTFGLDSASEMSEVAATAKPGSDDLLFLPALSGAVTPRWISQARGAFYGLTASHGRAECARALLEGCAFAMRDVVDRLNSIAGPATSIRVSGGGARSEVWNQIRADVSGLPVEIPVHLDTAPIGAALLALDSSGKTVHISKHFEPDPERREIYERCYRRYQRLFESLTPMFEE